MFFPDMNHIRGESYQRRQNSSNLLKHWNDVTQELHGIGRRVNIFCGLIVYKIGFVLNIEEKQNEKV